MLYTESLYWRVYDTTKVAPIVIILYAILIISRAHVNYEWNADSYSTSYTLSTCTQGNLPLYIYYMYYCIYSVIVSCHVSRHDYYDWVSNFVCTSIDIPMVTPRLAYSIRACIYLSHFFPSFFPPSLSLSPPSPPHGMRIFFNSSSQSVGTS